MFLYKRYRNINVKLLKLKSLSKTLSKSLSILLLLDIHPLSITKNNNKYNINIYPKGKMEWNEVKNIINTNKLEFLGRNEEQQKVYEEFRQDILLKYENVSQYLYITKFNFNSNINNNNNKLIAIRPDNIDINKTYLYLNDFPYNFNNNIKHYVLWKLSLITKEEVDEVAKKLVQDMSAIDYCTYINPPALKSVLDIEHGHILIYLRN